MDTEYDTRAWSQGRWEPGGDPAIAKNMSAEFVEVSLMKEAYKGKRLVGNGMKVAKKVQVHLDTILEELQTLDEADIGIDVEELLVPLKHVLDILQSDEKGGNHYE